MSDAAGSGERAGGVRAGPPLTARKHGTDGEDGEGQREACPGPYEGWAKAQPHELTAKKAGYQSEARRVTVSAGELLDVDLSLLTLNPRDSCSSLCQCG